MDSKKVVAFSLLAYIYENPKDAAFRDFKDIFKPLVKIALSKLNNKGIKSGENINEIKEEFDTLFRLDIPFPVLREILLAISAEVSKEGNNDFQIHRDKAFQMNKFIFADYEEEINSNNEEIKLIEQIYDGYLKTNGIEPATQPSIFEYIDQNRIKLANFFAHRQNDNDKQFIHQANFIETIKGNKDLFSILRKIYLGSIISAYLEVEIGEAENKIEFLFDTNFILGLLDLNSKESHHTCKKIIEVCNNLGYTKTVLPFTISETSALIKRSAPNLESSFFQSHIDPESIFSAAKRNNLSKTELLLTANNISKILSRDFGINILGNDEKYRNIAKFNSPEIFQFYKTLRHNNELSAWHDTTTVVYVKEKRNNKNIKGDFTKACCWFVTNTPFSSYRMDTKGFLPEIIGADELINALWLCNPNVANFIKSSDLVNIGLTRMVSSTISYSLPSSKTLHQLEENFKRYGGKEITADDTIVVGTQIRERQVTNLDELNKIAERDPKEFIQEVKKLAKKGRERERKIQESVNKLLELLEKRASQPVKQIVEKVVTVEKEKIVIVKDEKDREKISTLEKTKGKLFNWIAFILLLFASFLLWTFDHLFNLDEFIQHKNYWIIKISGQLFLICVTIAIIKKKDWKFWAGAAITALFAILMYFKK